MVWDTSAAAMVVQLRTQLQASTTWTAAGGLLANIHHPSANPSGGNGSTPDPLPLAEIDADGVGFRRYAEGAGALEQGMLKINLIFPATGASAKTPGQVETIARGIVADLHLQGSGIPFRDGATIGQASSPTPGAVAADTTGNPCAFRTILITLPYGLNP